MLDYGARHYDARIGRWTVPDPMAEKYYGLSAFSYCADNPYNNQDVEGCSIIWSVVSAVIDYGFQVRSNYQNGFKGREAWFDKVDFADVALSAIVPTGKLKVAGSILINVAKEVIDYSPEHNVVLDTNVGEVVKDAAINTAIDIGVDKVSKIASEYAQSAKKEVEQAVKEASHKQNISRNRPNSTKRREAAILATENIQVARDKEVAGQLINETTEFTTPTMKQALQQWHDNSNKQ